jgi:hypothetical protein
MTDHASSDRDTDRGVTDPVEIVPFGRADVQSFRWAHAEQDRITLVARATFDVHDDETLRRIDPDPLRGRDVVPFRDRADVLVFGDPDRHGERVPLSLEGETPMLDTTAHVLADRGARAVVPEALAVPEDVDWTAYQEAPATQQTTLLRGGERFVAGPLAGRIPRTRGVVYVTDAGAPKEQGDPIEMDLDAVHVDLDRRICSLVYRSVFLLDAADELDGRALHVGIEPENEVGEEAAGAAQADSAARARDALGHGIPRSGDDAAALDANERRGDGAMARDAARLGDRDVLPSDAGIADRLAAQRAPFDPTAGDGSSALAGHADPLARTKDAPFVPAAGDALTTLAGRTAAYDPRGAAPATWASSDAGGAAPATWTSDDLGRAQQAQRAGSSGASHPMMATMAFTAGAAAERGFPTDAGGASAMASEDQPGVRVKRSKPASAAPTPPGTAAVRRALYERFRP